MVAQNEEPTPARVPQGGEADVETSAPRSKVPASEVPHFNSEKANSSQPHLASTNSTIKRDAAAYGIKWKPHRENTFQIPRQAWKSRHMTWLKIMGRIGWGAKAVIYALLGGLACDNAVGGKSSASPQGAFVLIGTANGGRGALIVLAISILTYSVWRFWEGFIGQGYDDSFSNLKNFFKFRLSPLVSGGVYVAYCVLVCEVIPRDDEGNQEFLQSKNWPNSWRGSVIGRIGLCFVGIAFIAATIVQFEQFLTKSFHNTIRVVFPRMPKRFWKPFRWFVLTTGHIGVLGRAGIFLFAAVLFFRTVHGETNTGKSAFGNALAQLQDSRAGKAFLFIIGAFTCCYGLFCVLNIYARIFPTPPPSGVKKAHKYDEEEGPPVPPAFAPGDTGFHPLSSYGSNARQDPSAVHPLEKEPPVPVNGTPVPGFPTEPSIPENRSVVQPGSFSPLSNSLRDSLKLQGNHPTHR